VCGVDRVFGQDDVDLPDNMQRSMARQAEAEREKRAKIIHAAGEPEASDKLPLPIELL
jgi:regulator of protease activity HflC (stomatin/prohibitin superfamily)